MAKRRSVLDQVLAEAGLEGNVAEEQDALAKAIGMRTLDDTEGTQEETSQEVAPKEDVPTEEVQEVPEEEPKAEPESESEKVEAPVEEPKPKRVHRAEPKEAPKEEPKEESAEEPKEGPIEAVEAPKEEPAIRTVETMRSDGHSGLELTDEERRTILLMRLREVLGRPKARSSLPTLVRYRQDGMAPLRAVIVDIGEAELREGWSIYRQMTPEGDAEHYLLTVYEITRSEIPRLYRTVGEMMLE